MAFVVKFIILLAFFVFVFFAVNFFLNSISSEDKDKKTLKILFNLSAILAIILILLYFYNLQVLNNLEFIFSSVGSLILGYIFFFLTKSWIKNHIFLIKKRLEYGDFVEYNDEQYRFLSVYKGNLLLENIDGQVVEIPIKDELNIKKLENGICLTIGTNAEIDSVKKAVEKNPFIMPENIALYLEDKLNGKEPVLKLYIKDCENFQKVKQFKQFLDSKINL